MAPRATPSSPNATPAATPSSLNRPSCRLRYSLFGCVSLATNRSGQPSPLKSNTATPSDLLVASANPALALTSSNFPPPSLWNSFGAMLLYDSARRSDFVAASREHLGFLADFHVL